MISPAELAAQRRMTRMFIAADQFDVQLIRSLREANGQGGFRVLPPELVPGTYPARLIPLRDGATPRTTADGEEVVPGYMLQCYHDADVQRWDEFDKDGRRYQVVFVNENRQYQVKAEVIYRGE